MWCSECQADVSPAPDAPSSCGRCGGRLRMAGDATIREARDIISRWSSNDLLDRITSLPSLPEMSSSSATAAIRSAGQAGTRANSPDDNASEEVNDPAFSNDHQHDGQNDRSTSSQEEEVAALKDEFDSSSRSILEEIDKLAQRAKLVNSKETTEDSPYLKLTEIDRPGNSAPSIDVSRLYSQQKMTSPETEQARTDHTQADSPSLVTESPAVVDEIQPSDEPSTLAADMEDATPELHDGDKQSSSLSTAEPNEAMSGSTHQAAPTQEHADAPLLSSLLKESKSESVGQLAWWNLSERFRTGRDPKAADIPSAIAADTSTQSELTATKADNTESELHDESAQADQPSQLASDSVQTKNDAEAKANAENAGDPVNLTTSAQSAQKLAGANFSATDSEDTGHSQPILPKELRDQSQQEVRPAGSDRKRVAQPRRAQRRKQRDRTLRTKSADTTDVEQKGTKTVSRKYRVDNPNPEPVAPAIAGDAEAPEASAASSNSNSTSRRFRIDGAEGLDDTLRTGDSRTRTQGRSRQRYIDEPHADAVRGPHFQVVSKKRSNMASMTGQFLAYLGVLGLTVGTAIVIYGHFGGVSEYTPTGWLVTTVAQMMLFLGVINLVSGGIEQNNEDVSTRINTLGEQLMRIEQVTEQALKGPKISASRYANPNAAVDESRTRESVEVNK